MGQVLQIAVTLHEESCGECGGVYAINNVFRDQCYKKGASWTCPYCKCGWGFSGNSENSKLKRSLEEKERELEAERARKQAALNRANEAETNLAAATRREQLHKKRVAAGTCPCCQRTFKQLAAHMARKHPDYSKEKA